MTNNNTDMTEMMSSMYPISIDVESDGVVVTHTTSKLKPIKHHVRVKEQILEQIQNDIQQGIIQKKPYIDFFAGFEEFWSTIVNVLETLQKPTSKILNLFEDVINDIDLRKQAYTCFGEFDITTDVHSLCDHIDKYMKSDKKSFGRRLIEIDDCQGSGIGRGEIFVAYTVKSSKICGISCTYDIEFELYNKVTTKWEQHTIDMKFQRNQSDSIRTGQRGIVSQYTFYKNILKTMLACELVPTQEMPTNELKELSEKLKLRMVQIRRGEISNDDFKLINAFYVACNNVFSKLYNVNEPYYTSVTIEGPNTPALKYAISPTKPNSIFSVSLNSYLLINPKDSVIKYVDDNDNNIEKELYISSTFIRELSILDYINNPDSFTNDIKAAVENVIRDVKMLIIRPMGAKIVDKDTLSLWRVTQGRMHLKEQQL